MFCFLLFLRKNGISYFSWCCIKNTLQKQLEGGGVYLGPVFKVQCMMAWESWHQEIEASGHTVSTVSKQRAGDAGVHHTFSFSFHQSRVSAMDHDTHNLSQPNPDNPSQTCPKACLLGHSRACQVNNANHHGKKVGLPSVTDLELVN